MELILKDILHFPSLKHAQLVVDEIETDGLKRPVTGAMVMEALDIKDWGFSGQILLTSYFAFKHSTLEEINTFFSQAQEIGITGFIFKTDRLVNKIPSVFISNCHKYNFPLIQIPNNIKYTKIIKEISEALSNQNILLLKSYYENHQKFIKLMMKQADLQQIINTLENLIQLPITLIEQIEKNSISTNKKYIKFKKIKELSPTKDINNSMHYKKIMTHYTDTNHSGIILSFSIPTLGYEDYELLIHEVDDSLSGMHLMAIENTVIALQTELVKRYALRQNSFSHLNEVTAKLISGYITDTAEIEDMIHHLKLSVSDNYRVIIFSLHNWENEDHSSVKNRFIDKLIYLVKDSFYDIAFVQQPQKIIFIVPLRNYNLTVVKDKLSYILNTLTNEAVINKNYTIQTTISNEVSIYNLAEGYKQAINTQLITDLWDNEDFVVAYEDIGIFQLFLETTNIESVEKFIPEEIWNLHFNNPELLETLYTFINVNQRYSEAAKNLFVHPKTVRYRVKQLKNQYNIAFEDSEKMLFYNIAIRIIKYLDHTDEKNS